MHILYLLTVGSAVKKAGFAALRIRWRLVRLVNVRSSASCTHWDVMSNRHEDQRITLQANRLIEVLRSAVYEWSGRTPALTLDRYTPQPMTQIFLPAVCHLTLQVAR